MAVWKLGLDEPREGRMEIFKQARKRSFGPLQTTEGDMVLPSDMERAYKAYERRIEPVTAGSGDEKGYGPLPV
jgi:hypothetical protein